MIKVGVLLAGSGVMDGSEIHEATLTLYFLAKAGVKAVCMAPDIDQYHVINHQGNEVEEGQRRHVLTEAARIARGDIQAVASVSANDIDALIVPGGFGVAKNLCNFAIKGNRCEVLTQVESLIRELHQQGKPQGFLCIAPVLAASVLPGVRVTIGNDPQTAQAIQNFEGAHQDAEVGDIVIDDDYKVVSTPAYMLGPGIADIAVGIEKCVNQVIAWTRVSTHS